MGEGERSKIRSGQVGFSMVQSGSLELEDYVSMVNSDGQELLST